MHSSKARSRCNSGVSQLKNSLHFAFKSRASVSKLGLTVRRFKNRSSTHLIPWPGLWNGSPFCIILFYIILFRPGWEQVGRVWAAKPCAKLFHYHIARLYWESTLCSARKFSTVENIICETAIRHFATEEWFLESTFGETFKKFFPYFLLRILEFDRSRWESSCRIDVFVVLEFVSVIKVYLCLKFNLLMFKRVANAKDCAHSRRYINVQLNTNQIILMAWGMP